jgi:hypothetical protein
MNLLGFPYSADWNWRATSDATCAYNCLSWSVHRQDVYMWPDERNQFSWPVDMPRGDTVEMMKSFFERIGFRECKSRDHEEGFEKIVVYGNDSCPEHIARQLPSGKWTSKLGESIDIEHNDPKVLEGGPYGAVMLTMRRPWNGPPQLPPLHPEPPRLIRPDGMPLIP